MELKKQWFALKIKWETVHREFGTRRLLDALLAGGVYGSLAFFPLFVILVELMILNLHRLYTFAVLLILAAMAYVYVVNLLAIYTLKLKKPDHESDVKGLLWIHTLVWLTITLLVGLLFLIVIIPANWA